MKEELFRIIILPQVYLDRTSSITENSVCSLRTCAAILVLNLLGILFHIIQRVHKLKVIIFKIFESHFPSVEKGIYSHSCRCIENKRHCNAPGISIDSRIYTKPICLEQTGKKSHTPHSNWHRLIHGEIRLTRESHGRVCFPCSHGKDDELCK